MFLRLLALSATLLGVGCGALCNTDNACAVTGMAPDTQVCDGSNFVSCDDSNRGKVVSCPLSNRRATCSPNGWTFDTTSSQ